MQVTTIRKTKARKVKTAAPRKPATAAAPKTTTRKAIAEAVRHYMAAHYDSLIVHAALASGPKLDAMFAEIDRNLDASEQCTARLLAAQE